MAEDLVIRIKGQDDFSRTFDNAEKKLGGLNNMTEQTAQKFMVAGMAITGAGIALGAYLLKSALTAARTETLGVAMEQVGKQAGYSKDELSAQEKIIKELGITTQGARTILMRFMQSNLNIADASKLARAAQDFAVIGLVNSTEATTDLTDAVATQNPLLLRKYGIIKYLNDIYEDYARVIGKSAATLTQSEKQQAMLNTVLEEGKKVAGSYEASMTTAGKTMLSFDRVIEELENNLGRAFLPALNSVVKGVYQLFSAVNKLPAPLQDLVSMGLGTASMLLILGGGVLMLIGKLSTLREGWAVVTAAQAKYNTTAMASIGIIGKVGTAMLILTYVYEKVRQTSERLKPEMTGLNKSASDFGDSMNRWGMAAVTVGLSELVRGQDGAAESTKKATDKIKDESKSLSDLQAEITEITTLLSTFQQGELAVMSATAQHTLAVQATKKAQEEYNAAVSEFGPASDEAQAALANLSLAQVAEIQSADGVAVAVANASAKMSDGVGFAESYRQKLAELSATPTYIDIFIRTYNERYGSGWENVPGGAIDPRFNPQRPHQGGYIMGPPGADVPVVAQAGEYVIPANHSRLSHGGATTITIPVYLDKRKIAEAMDTYTAGIGSGV